MTDTRPTAEHVKARFLAERGLWPTPFEELAKVDTEFVEAYLDFSLAPTKPGVLEPKVREFVYISMDIAATHLYEDGARAHIAAAIRHGATRDELIDVCELAVLLGSHTMTVAMPILVEELAAAGQPLPTDLDEVSRQTREDYITDRGALPISMDALATLHPTYLDAWRRLSRIPFHKGNLDPKVIELIIIAMNASTTHLYEPGIRVHIRNALALGSTAAEILEVLELTSGLGIHGTHLGVTLVSEAFAGNDTRTAI